MSKLVKFLTSTDTPRWHNYASSATSLFIAILVIIVGNHWKNRDDIRVSEEKGLTDSMIQFQVHASSFAAAIMDKADDVNKARTVLLENLNEQYARAKQTELYGGSDLQAWHNYEEAILRMRDTIDKTSTVNNMGPFWVAASKLLVARNRLREQLKRIS